MQFMDAMKVVVNKESHWGDDVAVYGPPLIITVIFGFFVKEPQNEFAWYLLCGAVLLTMFPAGIWRALRSSHALAPITNSLLGGAVGFVTSQSIATVWAVYGTPSPNFHGQLLVIGIQMYGTPAIVAHAIRMWVSADWLPKDQILRRSAIMVLVIASASVLFPMLALLRG